MTLGRLGEDAALAHYRRLGYQLLERNYIYRHGRQSGEIDLIVARPNDLVFVEVKTRRSSQFGTPLEAVDLSKQRRLVRTAKLYLLEHPKYSNWKYRIDVAAVDIDNYDEPVIIVPNAIEDLD